MLQSAGNSASTHTTAHPPLEGRAIACGDRRFGLVSLHVVMAGLVPAIHVGRHAENDVDARAFAAPKRLRPRRLDKPGHDGVTNLQDRSSRQPGISTCDCPALEGEGHRAQGGRWGGVGSERGADGSRRDQVPLHRPFTDHPHHTRRQSVTPPRRACRCAQARRPSPSRGGWARCARRRGCHSMRPNHHAADAARRRGTRRLASCSISMRSSCAWAQGGMVRMPSATRSCR